MHFEILIEDQSGGKAMEILIPKLLGPNITYHIHPYKGIGHIPKGLKPRSDASKRILFDRLPHLLKGYGRVPNCGAIIIICDLYSPNLKSHQTSAILSTWHITKNTEYEQLNIVRKGIL